MNAEQVAFLEEPEACTGCHVCEWLCPDLAISVRASPRKPRAPECPSLASLQGNRACALAALAAGCRFFAGYPITPSSEIAEQMSLELPRVDGVFVQMEDEIGSLAAVIGASFGGAKAMTATSGPGFSLMQENLGYAAMTETPCVIVNVMRGGPSTGMPTRPAQGDFMQARWGTHGDHPIIVVAPASVQEIYTETIRAFNLAEEFRTPAIVLYDEVVAHLIELVELPARRTIATQIENGRPERSAISSLRRDRRPHPVMSRPGDGHRVHVTGLTHTAGGFPTQKPELADARDAAHPRQDRTPSRAHREIETLETGGRGHSDRRGRHRRARRAPRGAGAARRRDRRSGCSARSRSGRFRKTRCAPRRKRARASWRRR